MIQIETQHLLLRSWKAKDYIDFHEFMSDEKVAQCSGTRIISDINESKYCVQEFMKSPSSFSIVLKASTKVIGFIGFDIFIPENSSDNLKHSYIGYTINSSYWRKGLGTEAAKALIHYLFSTEKVNVIWSSHYDFNEASRGVIKNCGFQYKYSKFKLLKALNNKKVEELFYSIKSQESLT